VVSTLAPLDELIGRDVRYFLGPILSALFV
jgi:hypothetical protein